MFLDYNRFPFFSPFLSTNTQNVEVIPQDELYKYCNVDASTHGLQGFKLLKSAVINSSNYLRSLWKKAQHDARLNSIELTWHGEANLQAEDVLHLSQRFDSVVVAAGQNAQRLWGAFASRPESKPKCELLELPFRYVRGQNLHYKVEDMSRFSPSNHAVIMDNYVVFDSRHSEIILGSTREEVRGNRPESFDQPPDLHTAHQLLKDKIKLLCPQLSEIAPTDCRRGIRVKYPTSNSGNVPLVAQHPQLSSVWLVAGLGSRGLVHHAIIAKAVAAAILEGNSIGALPEDFRKEVK